MSGGAKLRPTLNIEDSEGRPVLCPAIGNNTPSSPGEVVSSKPTSKHAGKQNPSKNAKTPCFNNEDEPKVKVASPKTSAPKPSKPLYVSPPHEINTTNGALGKGYLKNGFSKTMGGGRCSPKLAASLDSGSKLSSFKGSNLSLTASSCSSSEGSSDSSCSLAAMKKAAALEQYTQRKLKIASYGRKQGSPKPVKVVPDGIPMSPPPEEAKKRCGWITPQSDSLYIAFHDEEWGVPVHDDNKLFELLVLSGALAEMSWPAILGKRDTYREVFSGFDPVIVANYDEKKIKSLKSNNNIMFFESKLRGIADNAKNLLKIIEEFGSFDNYCWSFVNHKPIVNKYKYPRHVPAKIPKAEVISKDLVKRGFRFVGPTIMYAFMQVTGMTNDHLVSCFRHEECGMLLNEQQLQCKKDHVDEMSQKDVERLVTTIEWQSQCKKDHVDEMSKNEVERLVTAIENTTIFQEFNEGA